jgi:hypothetical protein
MRAEPDGGGRTMNPPDQREWHRLFNAALNDQLSDTDKLELATLLKSSAEARQLWFVYHDNECSLAEVKRPVEKKIRRPGLSWFSLHPLAGAAAGIVFGMLCTSVVFAYAKPRSPVAVSKPLPLVDADFESGSQVPAKGIPARAGVWSGDYSRVVTTENGITPKHGKRMLRILRSDNELSPKNERSYVGEVAQVIDLRPLRAEFSTDEQLVEVSAHFNSIATPLGANYEFNVKAAAFRGDITDAPRLWEDHEASVSRSDRSIVADSDVTTWQRVAVPLVVPPDADFLVIECAIVFKGVQRQGAAEFPGHYVDQVEVRLNGSANVLAEAHNAK